MNDYFRFIDTHGTYDMSSYFYVKIHSEIYLKDELMNNLYYSLWFPGYFGFNWDALYDVLCDFSWIKEKKIILSHEGIPALPNNETNMYLRILKDSVVSWRAEGKDKFEVVFFEKDRSVVNEILRGAVSPSDL